MVVLVSISLVGLLAMTCVAADRWSRSGRDHGGGRVRGQLNPTPIGVLGRPDTELVRILDDPRFGDLRLSRPAQHDRRSGTNP